MRSTTGAYYEGLDHVRAVAAFLVVFWHFAHGAYGRPVPFNSAPELGLLDEGHVGVSLFMVLSGYLFAKLIHGRSIHYGKFLWNRALRLLPLLVVTILLVGLRQGFTADYWSQIAKGAVFPTLPNGGWSITVEAHFYLILPALLWVAQHNRLAPVYLCLIALAARSALYLLGHQVEDFAYWTIVGRADQFATGIFFSYTQISRLATAALAALLVISYAMFDLAGGFYAGPDAPWIMLPTIEAVAFGAAIGWYDRHPIRSRAMWPLRKAGEYSYSIYLLHPFLVFWVAEKIDAHVVRIDSVYLALPFALAFYAAMVAIGAVSYRVIEKPPMRWRVRYLRGE